MTCHHCPVCGTPYALPIGAVACQRIHEHDLVAETEAVLQQATP